MSPPSLPAPPSPSFLPSAGEQALKRRSATAAHLKNEPVAQNKARSLNRSGIETEGICRVIARLASTGGAPGDAAHCRMGRRPRADYIRPVFSHASPAPHLLPRLLGFFGAFLLSVPAFADHGVGHGASEGMRNLTTLAGNPSPRQRAALMTQVSRGTDEPTLNTATTYATSALVDIQLLRRLYLGAQLPFVVVDEDASDGVKTGLGDATVSANLRLDSMKNRMAHFTLGVNVTAPTRTIRYETDPGRQWVVSPGLRYGGASGFLFWYGLLFFPVETRPAGTAVDVSPAAGLGVRLFRKLSLSAGLNADIRAHTVCKTFDGSEVCEEGRVTETNRPRGATRLYAHGALSLDLSKNWSLFGGAQIPLSERRDVEWAAQAGTELRF